MPARFDCPHCKANYEVVDDLVGKMIMCRVCKKRAAVRGGSGTIATPSLTTAAASKSSSVDAGRRNFIIFGTVASLGAVGLGALLARRPWRKWGKAAAQSASPDGSPDQPSRRRRGPPPDGKKDDKAGGGA